MFDTDIPYITLYGVRDTVLAAEVVKDAEFFDTSSFVGMSFEGSTIEGLVVLGTGVACAAYLLDRTGRYIVGKVSRIAKPSQKQVPEGQGQDTFEEPKPDTDPESEDAEEEPEMSTSSTSRAVQYDYEQDVVFPGTKVKHPEDKVTSPRSSRTGSNEFSRYQFNQYGGRTGARDPGGRQENEAKTGTARTVEKGPVLQPAMNHHDKKAPNRQDSQEKTGTERALEKVGITTEPQPSTGYVIRRQTSKDKPNLDVPTSPIPKATPTNPKVKDDPNTPISQNATQSPLIKDTFKDASTKLENKPIENTPPMKKDTGITKSGTQRALEKEPEGYVLRRQASRTKTTESPLQSVQKESTKYDDYNPGSVGGSERQQKSVTVKDTPSGTITIQRTITTRELPREKLINAPKDSDGNELSLKGVLKSMPTYERTHPEKAFGKAHKTGQAIASTLAYKNGSRHERKSGLAELAKVTGAPQGGGYKLRRNIGNYRGSNESLTLAREKDAISQDLKTLEMNEFADALENLDNASTEADYDTADILEDLAEAMKTNVKIASDVNLDCFPRGFRDKLEGIRNISGTFESLSDEITSKALALLDQDTENDDRPEADITSEADKPKDPLAEVLKRRAYLRSQWLGLRRLLFCVDLQLRHAAGYHLFFEDARALKRLMLDFHKQLQQDEIEDAAAEEDESNSEGVKRVDLDELRKTAAYIQNLQTNVQETVKRSAKIVPMRKRKDPMTEPLSIQCVCALSSEKFDLDEGEPLKLIDNTSPYTWRVQNSSGQEDDVSSAYCVIPPPDPDAVLAAAQLEEALSALMDRYIETMRRRLLTYSKGLLGPILDKADPLLRELTPERKKDVLNELVTLDDACEDLFSGMTGYPNLEDIEQGLKDAVKKARLGLTEDPRVEGEVSEPIEDLNNMLEELQDLVRKRQAAKDFALKHGLSNYLDDDNLDWVVDLLDNPDRGVAISVQHQETEVKETTSFVSSSGEIRQQYSISAILDPRYGRHISMDEATAMGILDQSSGIYVHPISREPIPIRAAMNAGLIIVESLQTKLIHGPTKEVGLVTVSVIRENRPYTIKRVRNPATHEELNVVEAIERGIFDASRGMWINPAINEEVSAKNAIDSGLLIVDYDKDEECEPEVTTRTFAVYAVMDRRLGKRVPFDEACQKGIIYKEEGTYRDNRSGIKMHVIEAAKQGYVKMRVIESIGKLERFVSRDRSDSMDSLASGSSFG